jgi:PAS domain S-box-containing protein
MELDALSERLSFYAHNLEDEVERRAKALEESELRYRELYENIIDMVILVDAGNNIQMANPRFYLCTGMPAGSSNVSFMSVVHPDDLELVEEQMMANLLEEYDIMDFQFRIINRREGIPLDVECNAQVIRKEGRLIGYQMVIRDITVRKRLERDLMESYRHAQNARAATIVGLAKLAEYRDEDTGAHLERIREYARIIAEELSRKHEYQGHITPEYIEDIYSSSILHDIGKVGVPDSILLKPGKLTSEEFEIIKRHSTLGGEALSAVEAQVEGKSFLTLGREIAYYHHEKWDGSGYPEGRKGEDIPLSARIVALAAVYDALTSRRTYKEAYSHEKARDIIVTDRGKPFAPDVVDAFLVHEEEFRRIRQELLG